MIEHIVVSFLILTFSEHIVKVINQYGSIRHERRVHILQSNADKETIDEWGERALSRLMLESHSIIPSMLNHIHTSMDTCRNIESVHATS